MKRVLFICVLLYLFSLPVQFTATAETSGEIELSEYTEEQISDLDLDDMQDFADSLDGTFADGMSVKDYIKGVTEGTYSLNIGELFRLVCRSLFSELLGLLPMLIAVVTIAVMESAMKGVSTGLNSGGTHKTVHFVCTAAIVGVLLSFVINQISSVVDLLDGIHKLMQAVFPVLMTVMVALGEVVTSTAYQPMIAFLTEVVFNLLLSLALPLIIGGVVFCIVGRLSENMKLSKLTSLIRSVTEWGMAGVFGLFSSVLAVRGISGGGVDSVTVRATKFAISSYVPILGGYLTDGMNLVTMGLVLVKNSLGVTAMVLLLALVLAPILRLAACILGLKLVAALVEPLGSAGIADMLYDVSRMLTTLMVLVLGAVYLVFIFLLLIMLSANV